jgi:hypothetical protein
MHSLWLEIGTARVGGWTDPSARRGGRGPLAGRAGGGGAAAGVCCCRSGSSPAADEATMRWKAALIGWVALSLLGCPHAFGRGGTIDRAAAKDTRQQVAQPEDLRKSQKTPEPCPPWEELEQLCEDQDDDICPKECLEADGSRP